MAKKDFFEYTFVVTLKDINTYGTVYFARYFEWQGVARELYFTTVEDFQKILGGVALITRHAWNEYTKHIHLFDEIIVKVQNRNIKKCSFEMMFTFINKRTGEIVGRGGETLIFADYKDNILRLPEGVVKVITQHPYVE